MIATELMNNEIMPSDLDVMGNKESSWSGLSGKAMHGHRHAGHCHACVSELGCRHCCERM